MDVTAPHEIQKLYLSYFGRPADPSGLMYWVGVADEPSDFTDVVATAFADTAEFKSAYAGMDAPHVIDRIYMNLFGHSPDAAGLNFWIQAMTSGGLGLGQAVTMIGAGARGEDAKFLNNKVTAAIAFTSALDTAAEVLAYSGDAANNAARAFLAQVTDDASLQQALKQLESNPIVIPIEIVDPSVTVVGAAHADSAILF